MDFSKLRDFVDYMAAKRSPGCAVKVCVNGQPVFEHAAGFSNLEKKIPMTGQEYVYIYSCSKIATVTAAAQLLERGAFLLGDPLAEYLPAFREMTVRRPDGTLSPAKNPITVGDLFSMTAGFDYDIQSPALLAAKAQDPACPTLHMVRALAAQPLSFEPGTCWQYSLCHDILAGLVEAVSGMKFRDYVRKNLFEPLGMDHSFYHPTPEILARMAEQYQFTPWNAVSTLDDDLVALQKNGCASDGFFRNVGKENRFLFGPEYDSGGAGIITTCGDYLKLLTALSMNGGGILAPETVELMKTDRLTPEQRPYLNWPALRGYSYGLGVRTHIDRARSGSIARLGEFGWGGAAGATAVIDSELHLAVFFTQHTLSPREEWYQPRLRNVAYACLGD